MGCSKRNATRMASTLALLALAACSGSGTSPQSVTQENLGSNVLQLSVGTANIFGTSRGLNVVATYRQPRGAFHGGDSAVFVSTPSLSSPAALPSYTGSPDPLFATAETGPAPVELGTHTMTGTGQTSTQPTTFGVAGGVFGLGIEPFNANGSGSPRSITPFFVPLYDPATTCSPSAGCTPGPNVFTPWGGPPAFPSQRNSSNAGQLGFEEGLDVFMGMTPATGPYTLTVSVPANTGPATFNVTSGLGNANLLLPVISPSTPVLNGSGGASVKVGPLFGGISEAYVQIVDIGPPSGGSCNGSGDPNAGGTPTYYTLLYRKSTGTQSLPSNVGPAGAPSLCTAAQNTAVNSNSATDGDQFSVQVIGFDYPWYEASYPQSNGNPSPNIKGPGGQSDISISPQVLCSQPSGGAYGCTPVSSGSGGARRRHTTHPAQSH